MGISTEQGYHFHSKVKPFMIEGISMIGNLLNGSIIGLDEEGNRFVQRILEAEPIEKEYLSPSEQELLDCMSINGFFNPDEASPKAAYVHLTDRCNLHCVGCYSFIDERNQQNVLSLEEVCEILSKLKEAGVEHVVFSGGEPFIRKDIVEICRYAKEEAQIANVSLITNGTMNYKNSAEALSYIDMLSISIDGYNERTQFLRDEGIMPKIIKNIHELRDQVPITLIVTVHEQNVAYIDEYLAFAKKMDVQLSFSIFTVDPTNPLFKDFVFSSSKLLQFSNKILNLDQNIPIYDMPTSEVGLTCRGKCEVGHDLVSIGADGSIYPCHMLHDPELKLGNLLELSLDEAISNDKNVFLDIDVEKISGCQNCEYRYLCGGGCRGRSWLYSHDLFNRDAYCVFIKNFYRDSIKKLKQSIG
ncbi:radical SAM/SPASM domain-containing protein [Saccharibacillus sacchari]|uniref:Radical SAM protein n=1 Tax=Saccharibacillus sacchari TaxID=456493 RepID=A0ACC6P916_9BACL